LPPPNAPYGPLSAPPSAHATEHGWSQVISNIVWVLPIDASRQTKEQSRTADGSNALAVNSSWLRENVAVREIERGVQEKWGQGWENLRGKEKAKAGAKAVEAGADDGGYSTYLVGTWPAGQS